MDTAGKAARVCSCTYTTPTYLDCLHAGTVVHVFCVEWSVGSGCDPNKLITGHLPVEGLKTTRRCQSG